MAEYELIEERLISGKGVLKVPVDKVKNRTATLYLSVAREPKNKYLNLNYNPPRGRYAFLCYMRNGYVVGTDAMEFDRQSYDTVADISGQVLIGLKCTHQAVIAAIADLGTALGVSVSVAPNIIGTYENLNLGWDEVRIVCYADTAILAKLYRLEYDSCLSEYDDQRKPPPPEPPPPKVPPGTPLDDISPPYDGEDDDGNTEPYDGDEVPPEEPEIPDCTKLRVQYQIIGVPDFGTLNRQFDCYAPFNGINAVNQGAGGRFYGVTASCRGLVASGVCQPNQVTVSVNSVANGFTSLAVVSVTPLP